MAGAMTRRQGLPVKRLPETATFSTNTTVPPKSRFSPVVLFSLLLVVCLFPSFSTLLSSEN